VGIGSAGGYTVPEGFWNRVSETMLAYGNVAGVANVISTSTGNDLPWMTNDGTGNVGAILAENTQITEQDETFGVRTLGAYLYTSKLIRVSYQLTQDSAIDIEGFLARKIGERLARIHNQHQTSGTGTAQPEGIVTGAVTGKTTAGASAITVNEIIDLIHSVDPAYRQTNAKFMMSDGVVQYIRKIRDDSGGAGLGRPIWEPSIQVGVPDSIFGYPIVINQDMASTVATTNTTMLFGDFRSGYVVRNVKGMSIVRLDERYADYLQVGFFGYDRQDSVTDDTSAYKALVQA
jgi:HK97 family phage major capsid protein